MEAKEPPAIYQQVKEKRPMADKEKDKPKDAPDAPVEPTPAGSDSGGGGEIPGGGKGDEGDEGDG